MTMQPTLAAAEVKRNITQYLSTTFALADEPVREGLEAFFNDPRQGIFRGPYLRVRTPFRHADDSWHEHLEWRPAGFKPFLHQAKAFQRLSTLHGPAEPTLITTGTGSGKTESFLIPLLDHCRRERAAGNTGIKAVLLYPMNALATDQAQRLNEYLSDPALSQVTAGLYIGDTPETGYPRVTTARAQIRRQRPDILITNYKMLDLLLQREQDLPLWKDSALTYVVVDEFHTYDGAQGTDVAMLLRRLSAATGNARPGRPLGDICPVATSATLGQDGRDGASGPGAHTPGTPGSDTPTPADRIREVAATVFATEFGPDSVVGEDRLSVDEFIPKLEYKLPVPDPVVVAQIRDPHSDPSAMGRIMTAFTDRDDLTPRELGAVLRTHILTKAVLHILDGTVAPMDRVLEEIPDRGAYAWGRALSSAPEHAAEALARYVALLSTARDPDAPEDGPDRPLVTVETHLWVRSVSRLLRAVADRPSFAWHGETLPALGAETTNADLGRANLPAVYCRHCGRSGWAAVSPESSPSDLVTDPDKVYRGAISSKKYVRPLIRASRAEAKERPAGTLVLNAAGTHLRPVDAADITKHETGQLDGVFVLADLGHTKESFRAAENDRCPACDADQGTRFLGSGLAALASVAVTELFTGGQLAHDGEVPKTLMFSDSVQDAAHRAGFVSNRSYTFSARALLASRLPADGSPIDLNDLIADTVEHAGDPAYLACVVPPDMHDLPGIDRLLAGESGGGTREWDLVGERLAFTAVLEFGLRSRQGRTLELTRTAAAQVRLDEPDRIAALARDILQHSGDQLGERLDLSVFRGYVRGLLERVRTRGGIGHHWLDPWVHNAGTKRFGTIWGQRPDGMPAFPKPRGGSGLPAPRFVTDQRKERSEFDSIAGSGTWYQDWTVRCLQVKADTVPRYLGRLLDVLHDEGLLTRTTAADGSTRIYGLTPGHVQVRALTEGDAVVTGGLRCHVCNWRQTVHPDHSADWEAAACPRYRCTGRLTVDEDRRFSDDYYRRLYREAQPFRITTAEHTGQLTRAQRERVEDSFKRGTRYTDPNVLSATPTLELGIDIGALSAVLLGSLPTGPANYVQRAGRAGRRSGNAFLLTLVGRRARERYYLEEPLDMIAGQIAPPGSFPSAVEILRRQYAAHLLDLAARGELTGVPALPGRAADLFGDLGWLRGFTESALASGDRLVTGFLDLFEGAGAEVDPDAAAQLRHYATAGLKETVARTEEVWAARLNDLRERVETVTRSIDALLDSDKEQKRRKRALQAERTAVRKRIGEIGRTSAHGALVDLGVLPNYSLVDGATELEATLTWEERSAEGDRDFRTEVREYKRPAARALTEFAPGNHYYVRGYRHTVDGLDIGSMTRPAWRDWRVCPGCGYVRTDNAAADTSPCPRCDNTVIADRSSLYRVLEPTRVYARDRREDALIRDEHDERQRVFYETATAVDIPEDAIEPGAWRHSGRVFGVEFTREAVIRRFNLGALRMNRPATVTFAGNEVTPTPFQVCRACGGATADEAVNATSSLLGSSYDARPGYHRPWCPQRRGDEVEHERIILAHTLRTEALRILLPVATVHTAERIISFKAALMAGFARVYGGALDHLAATVATMPDEQTGHRRRYLVIHDTLPGGSGYLNPRSGDEGIREVLTAAHHVVADCSCKDQEGRAACHRCLLAHVSDREFPHADRLLAQEMLEDLLEDWQTDSIARTDDISLWDQVESELEARFLQALQRWAKAPDAGRSFELGGRVNGRRSAVLRLIGPNGGVIGWEVLFQNTIKGTRPDVVFRRLDTGGDQVALYLDGYTYHASPEHNRIADDADKRARLRAHGITVFQLNWDDLDHLDGKKVPHPAWEPYGPNGRRQAQDAYRAQGGDPRNLDETVWDSPSRMLFSYLGDPDPKAWVQRATAAVTGTMRTTGVEHAGGGAVELTPHVVPALRGAPLPKRIPGQGCVLIRATDDAGCRMVLVANKAEETISAFTVLDDRDEALTADPDAHRRRWKSWLYWGNLVQFLTREGGDAGQFAISALDALDATVLSAVGGDGLDDSLARQPLDPAEAEELFGDTLVSTRFQESGLELGLATLAATAAEPTPVPSATGPGPEVPADGAHTVEITVDPGWDQVRDLMEPDEPGLVTLAGELARRGVPAPEAGYELEGPGLWPAELAWPDRKVAVLLSAELIGNAEDRARGEEAYARAGWHVREANQWDVSELARILTGDDGDAGAGSGRGDDDATTVKG
ncbi:DEAD/DEAH box helicase [Nocardiopsis akebiae]|uniref:DEAD/DEAH box helicase n=2 Tax=Nocardiopsis akebiae TaxID=2831968 RepID=A0ABX8CF16_9ACTN|nr:DEAD/DEAH box helicase [Nocardiopsis akebiae]